MRSHEVQEVGNDNAERKRDHQIFFMQQNYSLEMKLRHSHIKAK